LNNLCSFKYIEAILFYLSEVENVWFSMERRT